MTPCEWGRTITHPEIAQQPCPDEGTEVLVLTDIKVVMILCPFHSEALATMGLSQPI
jgi:hypothetical protein